MSVMKFNVNGYYESYQTILHEGRGYQTILHEASDDGEYTERNVSHDASIPHIPVSCLAVESILKCLCKLGQRKHLLDCDTNVVHEQLTLDAHVRRKSTRCAHFLVPIEDEVTHGADVK